MIKIPPNINFKYIDPENLLKTCNSTSMEVLGCTGMVCSECVLNSIKNYTHYIEQESVSFPQTKWTLSYTNLIPQQILSLLITIELYDNEILVMTYVETNKPVLKSDDWLLGDIDFSGW